MEITKSKLSEQLAAMAPGDVAMVSADYTAKNVRMTVYRVNKKYADRRYAASCSARTQTMVIRRVY